MFLAPGKEQEIVKNVVGKTLEQQGYIWEVSCYSERYDIAFKGTDKCIMVYMGIFPDKLKISLVSPVLKKENCT